LIRAADAPERLSSARTHWVVERTLAWLTTSRGLTRNYERLTKTGEMLLYLAMSRALLWNFTSDDWKYLGRCEPTPSGGDLMIAPIDGQHRRRARYAWTSSGPL
jgi:hypothetical protein